MKKRESLLLLAGASLMIGFASCQQEGAGSTASQATIDSIVNVKVDSIRTALQAQNDSLINAMAYQKADSIVTALKAANNGKAPASVPKPKPAPSKNTSSTDNNATSQTTPPKQGGMRGQSDQAKQQEGKTGMRGQSDQAKQQQKSSGTTSTRGMRGQSDQSKQQ